MPTNPAEEQIRAIIDQAAHAMLVVDRIGRIRFVNDRAEQLFGYSRADLMHQPIELLVPTRLRASHADHRKAFLGNVHVRAMADAKELRCVRKDHTEFAGRITLYPLETTAGLLVAVGVATSD